MAEFKAEKKLTFVREGGDIVVEAGETFTPDKSMNVDQMRKSGKISEVGGSKRKAVKRG